VNAPPPGTVERWAWDLVMEADPRRKLEPPAPPREWEVAAPPRRIAKPGRPPGLETRAGARKTPSAAAMRAPEKRALLLESFLHHEVQAAELMAWALLAFPDAPAAMRRGLCGILGDELRHVRMYGEHIASLGGAAWGERPVNDWFWERVPQATSPAAFVATLGIGFEGGNLDHAARFAVRLRAAGDARAATLQETVGEEEIPHVRFALHWFRELTGGFDFDSFRAHLPSPLTPTVARGVPLNVKDRKRAGFDDAFLAELAAWSPGS
jgi:uncharacterized ferritin-like protein (DUF455 family)